MSMKITLMTMTPTMVLGKNLDDDDDEDDNRDEDAKGMVVLTLQRPTGRTAEKDGRTTQTWGRVTPSRPVRRETGRKPW